MRLAKPALPPGWVLSRKADGTAEVRMFNLGREVPGSYEAIALAAGCLTCVTPLFLFGLCHWTYFLLGRQHWQLGPGLCRVTSTLFGIKFSSRSFEAGRWQISSHIPGTWELQLVANDKTYAFCRSAKLSAVLELAAWFAAETGWEEVASATEPEYLRALLLGSLKAGDVEQLRQILSDPRTVHILERTWREAGPAIRRQMYSQFTELERTHPWLADLIDRHCGALQVPAIDILAELKDGQALPTFRKIAAGAPGEARTRAILALGQLRDSEMVPRLIEALRFDPGICSAAVMALGEIGDPQAVPGLLELLVSSVRGSEAALRLEVVSTLEKIGDRSAASALIDLLDDRVPLVRERAIETLGRWQHLEAVPPLIEALGDGEKQVAARAAEVLGALQDPRAAEPLARTLASGYQELRVASAEALGFLGGDHAVVALLGELEGSDERVCVACAQALAQLAASGRAAPILLRATLPKLRSRCGPFASETAEIKAAFHGAIQEIEARTAHVKHLPLPASPGPLTPAALPRPIEAPSEAMTQQRT